LICCLQYVFVNKFKEEFGKNDFSFLVDEGETKMFIFYWFTGIPVSLIVKNGFAYPLNL
jgi:hypothetical protein